MTFHLPVPLCCLKGSPWIAKNHNIPGITPVCTEQESTKKDNNKKVVKKEVIKQGDKSVSVNSEKYNKGK